MLFLFTWSKNKLNVGFSSEVGFVVGVLCNHCTCMLHLQAHLDSGGYEGSAMNRKYKYSRFKPIKTYKDSDGGSAYSCVTFSVSFLVTVIIPKS